MRVIPYDKVSHHLAVVCNFVLDLGDGFRHWRLLQPSRRLLETLAKLFPLDPCPEIDHSLIKRSRYKLPLRCCEGRLKIDALFDLFHPASVPSQFDFIGLELV